VATNLGGEENESNSTNGGTMSLHLMQNLMVVNLEKMGTIGY